MKNHLIFKVNRLVQAVEVRFGLNELDFTSRAFLNMIAEADSERRALRVCDIVKLQDFATPPTVYSHLAKLREAGWIRYKEDLSDRRAKLVLLTPSARNAFNMMSDEVHKMTKGSRAADHNLKSKEV
jgi:DNA-binding transcriptional ArsR family regulator